MRYTFFIPSDLMDIKLSVLIQKMLPALPEYAIREAFEKRDVKMNGARVSKEVRAAPGAEVLLYTRHRGTDIPIVYEDANLMLVRKPAGISCEADGRGGKTVTQWAAEASCRKGIPEREPLLCHRLDNQTEGLLLLAKHEHAQAELMEAFRLHTIHKIYTCLVKGEPKPPRGMLRAYLLKDSRLGRVQVMQQPIPGGRAIATEYQVLEAGLVSRLEVRLHTGRTHQIRAQLAAIHHPILGDDIYGDRAFNRAHKARRLKLCASALFFSLAGEMAYLNERFFSIDPMF